MAPKESLSLCQLPSRSACRDLMMKVRYIKVLRETYNIRTRYLCYLGGFDLEGSVAIAPKALFWRTTQCDVGVVVIGLVLGSRVAAAS